MNPKASSPKGARKVSSLSSLLACESGGRTLVPPVLREVGKLAAGVASVSTKSGGSATGNPRNKHALQPGHSLMDWIRLGASGRDLTGVGPQAGNLAVSPTELALHNKNNDAWLCIRGRVFNVTAYLPFHPGGPEELMRAVGTDATTLFDEVHPWVNFEQILNKCYIGPLRSANFDIDHDSVFGKPASPPKAPKEPLQPLVLPKFDWIQKLEFITVFFYTGNFSNPLVEIQHSSNKQITIALVYGEDSVFNNELVFHKDVQWPCQTRVTWETGKIELVFRKSQAEVWTNYGVLKQSHTTFTSYQLKCSISKKIQVNHNTFLIELEREDRAKMVVPLGKHVRVFSLIQEQEESRSYTPIPECLFGKFRSQSCTTDSLCLMVKRYEEGVFSKLLTDSKIGDSFFISKPIGSFQLPIIERRETFIILAAGTGITPMFSIILFLLERRIRKCQRLRLLFFNRTSKDLIFLQQFEDLSNEDARFKFYNVLSQPEDSWSGLKGHINKSLLQSSVVEHLKDTTYVNKDIYFMVCGPAVFTTLSQKVLNDLGYSNDQMHCFLG